MVLNETSLPVEEYAVYSDKQGAIRIAHRNSSMNQTKHVYIKLQFVKDNLAEKQCNLLLVKIA